MVCVHSNHQQRHSETNPQDEIHCNAWQVNVKPFRPLVNQIKIFCKDFKLKDQAKRNSARKISLRVFHRSQEVAAQTVGDLFGDPLINEHDSYGAPRPLSGVRAQIANLYADSYVQQQPTPLSKLP
ncbi:MAG: hypothetical protein EBT78_16170 [Betaproteobacteria bacterium]|nr:hypothetical protein [Betaproteobacteria bacterium]